jgi:hypothetical protein
VLQTRQRLPQHRPSHGIVFDRQNSHGCARLGSTGANTQSGKRRPAQPLAANSGPRLAGMVRSPLQRDPQCLRRVHRRLTDKTLANIRRRPPFSHRHAAQPRRPPGKPAPVLLAGYLSRGIVPGPPIGE